ARGRVARPVLRQPRRGRRLAGPPRSRRARGDAGRPRGVPPVTSPGLPALLVAALVTASARAGGPVADWGVGAPHAGCRARPWMGVVVTRVEGSDGVTAGVPGVSIASVAVGGPAAKAGLRQGDVLLSLGDVTVADPATLMAA